MASNSERIRVALCAGAVPVQVACKDPMSRRALAPQFLVYGPEGDILVLAQNSKITPLGKEWDRQMQERDIPRARSRSPVRQNGQNSHLAGKKSDSHHGSTCRDRH